MSRKRHKGPPPHIGWWEASRRPVTGVWRWWDGEQWSMPVLKSDDETCAAYFASRPVAQGLRPEIKWTTYWPKNARVPRVKP